MASRTPLLCASRRTANTSMFTRDSPGLDLVRESEFVSPSRVAQVGSHRPHGELMMQGHHGDIFHGKAHGLLRERLTACIVRFGERLLDQPVELGVRVV